MAAGIFNYVLRHSSIMSGFVLLQAHVLPCVLMVLS
jgi:hypothetical protein